MDSYSKLLELVNTSGCFAPANHMYVTELRPDHSAVGVLEVQPSSLNPMGIVHGGALVTLADTVCGTAAFTTGKRSPLRSVRMFSPSQVHCPERFFTMQFSTIISGSRP